MADLLFYQELVLLDRKEHGKLRLKKLSNTDFARGVNSVPLAGIEFFDASRDLPILFTRSNNNEFVPLAVLSFQSKGNNLADNWGDCYIPAFIRRYPFALTDDGRVLFDKQAPHLQEEEGDPLFKEDGENSEFLENVGVFLNRVESQLRATREYCQALDRLEMLTPFKAQVSIEKDKAVRLDNLFVIDDKKLAGLPDEEITNWFRKGWLGWSYAHLHSLGAASRVVSRDRQAIAARAAETAPA
ncbi:MAG TPA: SapC family protein [Gammaproteobacteria bacterium]